MLVDAVNHGDGVHGPRIQLVHRVQLDADWRRRLFQALATWRCNADAPARCFSGRGAGAGRQVGSFNSGDQPLVDFLAASRAAFSVFFACFLQSDCAAP
jgi:hypothetical protein